LQSEYSKLGRNSGENTLLRFYLYGFELFMKEKETKNFVRKNKVRNFAQNI